MEDDWISGGLLASFALSPALLTFVLILMVWPFVRRELVRWSLPAAGLLAGVLAAVVLANTMPPPLVKSPVDYALWIPLREEAFKAFFVLIVLLAARVRGPVPGLVIGLFVGLGFTVFENNQYFDNSESADELQFLLLARTLIPLHVLATGIVGIGVGAGRARRSTAGAAIALGGLGLAVALHGVWNSLPFEDWPHFIAGSVFVLLGIAALWVVARRQVSSSPTPIRWSTLALILAASLVVGLATPCIYLAAPMPTRPDAIE